MLPPSEIGFPGAALFAPFAKGADFVLSAEAILRSSLAAALFQFLGAPISRSALLLSSRRGAACCALASASARCHSEERSMRRRISLALPDTLRLPHFGFPGSRPAARPPKKNGRPASGPPVQNSHGSCYAACVRCHSSTCLCASSRATPYRS